MDSQTIIDSFIHLGGIVFVPLLPYLVIDNRNGIKDVIGTLRHYIGETTIEHVGKFFCLIHAKLPTHLLGAQSRWHIFHRNVAVAIIGKKMCGINRQFSKRCFHSLAKYRLNRNISGFQRSVGCTEIGESQCLEVGIKMNIKREYLFAVDAIYIYGRQMIKVLTFA